MTLQTLDDSVHEITENHSVIESEGALVCFVMQNSTILTPYIGETKGKK
jgi:hypothetical protein